MQRPLSWLLFVLMLLSLCTWTRPAFAETGCKLSMGYEHWEPYQYLDAQGSPTGLDIELLSAIVDNMGCQLILKDMPWKRHLTELKLGRVNLAAGASKTPEREAYAFFSDAYRMESVALYVRLGEYEKYNFNQLTDIIESSFQLGVTLGYYYGDEFEKLMKTAEFSRHIQEVPYDYLNYDKLMAYRIDGFLADPIATAAGLKQKRLLGKIEKHPMRVYATDIFVMFGKKSTTMKDVERFNQSLLELRKNGRYDQIMNRYMW